MRGVCAECGDTKPLNADGVCAWRHGCEHRQFRHVAAMERLEAEMRRVERQTLFAERYGRHPAAFWLGYDLVNPLSFLLDYEDDPDEGDT